MLDKETLDAIHQNYHASHHNNDWHNNNLGFGFMFYGLARNWRPEKILVVGSQKGFTPSLFALACKDEGKGKVYFVDAGFDYRSDDYNEAEKSWGGLGVWKYATKDYWKAIGCEKLVEMFVMKTEDFVKQDDSMFDVIYIDGDHSYEGVKKDYQLLWDRLNAGGLMIFHDILVEKQTDWGKCGVKQFWDELTANTTLEHLVINFDAGLGIIKKDYEKI